MFAPELAKERLDTSTSLERAAAIVQKGCRPAENFRCFRLQQADWFDVLSVVVMLWAAD